MNTDDFFNFGSNIFEYGFAAFCVTLCVTWVLLRVMSQALQRTEKTLASKQQAGQGMTFHFLFSTIRTLLKIVGAVVVLSQIKMLKAFGTAALGATSILAVGVSLAAQETFSNFISGFFLSLYQPFQIGDLIILSEKGITGTVKEITLRHTVIRTVENTTIIIPNSVMNSAIIEDRTAGHSFYANSIVVTVGYDTDLDRAKQLIRSIVISQPEFIDTRTEKEKEEGKDAVTVRVNNLGDNGIELRIMVRTSTYGGFFNAASNIRQKIVETFREEGITIPYPTRTVELVQNSGN